MTRQISHSSRLVWGACVAVAMLTLAAIASGLVGTGDRSYEDSYWVAEMQARLAGANQRFPPNSVLALVTDMDRGVDLNAIMVIRYAVMPRQLMLLDEAEGPKWAIGVFKDDAADRAALGAAHGYRVEGDLGGGVTLYRRAKP